MLPAPVYLLLTIIATCAALMCACVGMGTTGKKLLWYLAFIALILLAVHFLTLTITATAQVFGLT